MNTRSTARPTSPMDFTATGPSTARTSAGVGYSENANSREAGLEAAPIAENLPDQYVVVAIRDPGAR